MRTWERVWVSGGWVVFGSGLAMRADLVQRVDVTQAGERYRVEVKDAARAAPFVVFEGTERQCRRRLWKLTMALMNETERARKGE